MCCVIKRFTRIFKEAYKSSECMLCKLLFFVQSLDKATYVGFCSLAAHYIGIECLNLYREVSIVY